MQPGVTSPRPVILPHPRSFSTGSGWARRSRPRRPAPSPGCGLILEDPQAADSRLLQFDPRTRLLPIRLLFHDRFDPPQTLANLRTPKLMLYSAQDANGLLLRAGRGAEAKGHRHRSLQATKRSALSAKFSGKYLFGS